jgi:NAD(P)-dependent dehydrogenase (short-subunit alcohol dehydrogenase family)
MELGPGKVAVVTGAGSGIGLALANAFAASGCAVVLADVEEDALHAAAAEVGSDGVDTLPVVTDVSKREQVDSLADAAMERFGAVHAVCNNAGVGGAGDPWLGPIETWEWVMGVNPWGVVHGVRAFLPHIVMSGGGHIVNTASIAGVFPGMTAPPYDASKHAVVAITEDLYTSLREGGIPVGVSCLCPGWVRTGIGESDRNWPDELGALPERDAAGTVARGFLARALAEGMQPAAVADLVLQSITSGRFWIFPQREFLDLAVARWRDIDEGLDPSLPEQVPGLPPRSHIMAEVMAAMLAESESESDPGPR